jgi:hypothetical protein
VNYTQIVGWPSQDALILLLTHLGYTIERLDRYTQRQFQRVAIVAAKQASCRTE